MENFLPILSLERESDVAEVSFACKGLKSTSMADNHDPNEEEEEEEEPKLKYERVGRGVEELVARDTLSCFVTHEKFIVR